MSVVSLPEAQLQRETLIGRGLTAEVFSWGHDRVLKLCLPWRPLTDVQREFAVTQAIHAAGLPAPAAFEMLVIGDRHGIVFERLHGPSLVRQVETRPWTLFAAARQLAELHARPHALPAPANLLSQRQKIEACLDGASNLSPAQKEIARRHLARLPPEDCVCHGDFHPGNIILTARGPVIIDWSAGTRGYGPTDVARTCVLFESAPVPPGASLRIRILIKLTRRLVHAAYLKYYLALRPATLDELETWRVLQRMVASAWIAQQRAAMARGAVKAPP
jgi:aminoglycoside phosphotransferase (APT) family kinase protein